MIEIVGKDEIAERKPYKFSSKVAAKILQRKKEKEQKRKNMARIIAKIDALDEIIPDDSHKNNLMRVAKA